MKHDTRLSVLRGAIPSELWAIRVGDESGNGQFFAPPADDDGTQVIMAWPTKKEAHQGLTHQINMGYFDADECELVRIK